MRIVQTFWSGNREHILNSAFGWYDSSYHLQSWALSCQLLRRLHSQVELYTDQTGYDLLIKKLKLPYTKVHVVLGDLNEYSSAVWALSKIRTYSLQTTPFIHVDGDVFLWKAFSTKLLESELIVQNREIGNRYFESSWEVLESKLNFIPKEVLDHRQKEKAVNVYNFGVFGGTNLDFIKEYSKKAFEFVDKNLDVLDSIKEFNFNIFFEQYLFYCMAQGEAISTYFDRDFIPDQYQGLASFEDIPNQRNYLHLLGNFKLNPEVCCNMSRHLSVEFPEQYDGCLDLFNSPEKAVFDIQRNQSTPTEHPFSSSFASYYKSISFEQKFLESRKLLKPHFCDLNNSNSSLDDLEEKITEINHQEISKIFQRELKVDQYLSSLHDLNFVEYARMEYQQYRLYLSFTQSMEDYQFQRSQASTILKEIMPAGLQSDTSDQNFAETSRLIIPSAKAPFYNEIILDDLEEAILHECQTFLTMNQLLIAMKAYFNEEDLKDNYTNYKKLICNSVKRLSYQRALSFQLADKEILSRRIDTSLECL